MNNIRRFICWAGVLVIVFLFFVFFTYDAPSTGGHWEYGEEFDRHGGYAWVENANLDNAPSIVRFVYDWQGILIIVGIALVYGGLKK
ncbi:MAG: hypothetical protein PHF74_08020 [Dehalococcoidales bacterium]|nr:hypothetical protein [Dehalococcoidales bacterium]